MPRRIIHLDMDAFYAAIEQRDVPELRGKPLIVGGDRMRGVVATASYEARPYGVHSAMPMAQALKLCPHAIVVPPRRARYVEASQQIFAILRSFTPLVEPLSLDEAFLDVTASEHLFGSASAIAQEIKTRIVRFEKFRESYLARQKELLGKLNGASNDERELIRRQLQELRDDWLDRARAFKEDARSRMRELQDQLPKHRGALNDAKEGALDQVRKRRGDGDP